MVMKIIYFAVYTEEELDVILSRDDLLEQHQETLREIENKRNVKNAS